MPNPVASVTTLFPNAAPAGALAFTLTVTGSNFVSGSLVEWNGRSRTTTFVSNSEVTAQIPATDLAGPGKAAVTVFNPAPGGGKSNPVTFTVAPNTIAFQSGRALDGSDNTNGLFGVFNVWIMNSDGSGAVPLTTLTVFNADTRGPFSWSPDGSRIGFESARALDGSDATNTNFGFNVWVVNADGSGATPLTRLTFSEPCCLHPLWSPDGSKIAFGSERALDGSNAANAPNFTSNIWVMNADGSNPTPLTRLTAANASGAGPIWSPDGSKIAFTSTRALDGSNAANTNSTENIWVMNADGSNAMPLTRLTANNANSFLPSWSPDGGKIAFTSTRALDGSDATNAPNSTQNVWLMNADGSSPTPLTKLTALGAHSVGPSPWSPDGAKVLFSSQRALDGSDASDYSNNNLTENVWVVNADGSSPTPLTRITGLASAISYQPVWWPSGTKVLFASGRALDGSNTANANGTQNIWVMNADGSGPTPFTKLTAATANNNFPEQP